MPLVPLFLQNACPNFVHHHPWIQDKCLVHQSARVKEKGRRGRASEFTDLLLADGFEATAERAFITSLALVENGAML